MLKLPGNLAVLARIASKDATRYSLNAVSVRETTEGYQVVATDGRRMAIVTGAGVFDESIPELEESPDDAIEALVPASEWNRILKEARRESAYVSIGKNVTTIVVGNGVSTVQNQEGRFPDIERTAMDLCRSMIQVRIDARLLAELLHVAAIFGSEYAGDAPVTLHFGGRERPLLVTTKNSDGQRFEAAIMPLS
jgi:DNA polymerase III sliding clamp (beta) subunit (PCNA family)